MKKFTLLLAAAMFSVALFAETKTDVLNQTDVFKVSGTTYKDVSATVPSGTKYVGNIAGDKGAIQLRSKNSNSGIVSTISIGKIKSIAIKWNSSTVATRTLDIYGKNKAYTAATDLYDSNLQGTKIGSVVMSGGDQTITIEGNYAFIGLRSNDGAMYIDQITIVWEIGTVEEIPATAIELDQTSLDLEEGAISTLVATLTPAEATTAVVWTSSDETVATVNNGTVNAVKAGTATITATAGEGITATCEVTVREQTPKTLAEIDYTTDGTEYKLAPITVVYVNGKSIYVQDATGAGLIYGSALVVNAGDVVSGLVVTTKVFNKLPELETTATNEEVTIISGTAPSPVEATAAPVATEVNKYLLLKDVVFAEDATTLSGNYAQNVKASFKGEQVTIRDNFKITDGTILAGTYEIEGFVCLYNTTVQFYPTKITSTPTAIENATVAEKAVKMIEDGQLVIIREGVKYNAQGAVIR